MVTVGFQGTSWEGQSVRMHSSCISVWRWKDVSQVQVLLLCISNVPPNSGDFPALFLITGTIYWLLTVTWNKEQRPPWISLSKLCMSMYLKFLSPSSKQKLSLHIFVCTTSKFSQSYGFSSSHIWMWELDYKESWVLKHRCLWIVVLEKKEISPEGLMLKLKLPILWPPDASKWLLGKRPQC